MTLSTAQRFLAVLLTAWMVPIWSLGAAEPIYPGSSWAKAAPGDVGLDETQLQAARDYALTAGGAGYVIRHGKLVYEWGDPEQRYDLKSSTKGLGITALGLAMADGEIELDDKARAHHPSFGVPPERNAGTGWLDQITIRHLATQTAGFAKPGGYEPLLFRPGTRWHYSDSGPNWLAECITLAYRKDLEDLLFEQVFGTLGIARDDLRWRNNAYRPDEIEGIPRRELGSGIHANVDAMARIGYLYLRRGRWRDEQLLPRGFVGTVSRPVQSVVGLPEHEADEHGNASDHYGLLWWNNGDGALENVPRDAFWTWGLYDSITLVIPSLDLVVARAGPSGRQWSRSEGADHYDVLRPFFEPIAASVRNGGSVGRQRAGPLPAEPGH